MAEYTEQEIIQACRIIRDGGTFVGAVTEILNEPEYPELAALTLQSECHAWYVKQTPARLMMLLEVDE